MPILEWDEVGKSKIMYPFIGGLHTNINRRTKQNAATLWVYLVLTGPPWRPLWPRVWDMLILD